LRYYFKKLPHLFVQMAAVATPSWRYGPLGSDAGSDVMTITTERIVRAYDSAESFCTVYGGSADQMQLCDTTSMLPAWDAVASDSDLDSDSDGVASNDDLQDILSEAETSLDYFDLEELAPRMRLPVRQGWRNGSLMIRMMIR
jgi:hypothetical protein